MAVLKPTPKPGYWNANPHFVERPDYWRGLRGLWPMWGRGFGDEVADVQHWWSANMVDQSNPLLSAASGSGDGLELRHTPAGPALWLSSFTGNARVFPERRINAVNDDEHWAALVVMRIDNAVSTADIFRGSEDVDFSVSVQGLDADPGTIGVRKRRGFTSRVDSESTYATGDTVAILVRAVEGDSGPLEMYINGRLEATATDTDAPRQGWPVYCREGFYQFIGGAYWHKRAPSAEEAEHITADPWVLIRPQPRRAYFLPAAGGATVKTVTDTASGADALGAVSVSLALADSATGSDALPGTAVSATLSDAGVGADALGVAAALGLTDAGIGSDQIGALAAALAIGDTASGIDAIAGVTVSLDVADSGSGADAVNVLTELLKTVTDSGVGTDTIARLSALLSVADTASGADAVNVITEIVKTVADSGLGSDTIGGVTVDLQLADTATGTDAVGAIVAILALADTGTGVDAVATFDSATRIVSITFTLAQRAIAFSLAKRSIAFALNA